MPGQLITNEDSSPPGAKGQQGGRGQRGLPGDFGEFGLPGLPGPYGQLGVEGLSVGLMNSRLFETFPQKMFQGQLFLHSFWAHILIQP